MAGGDASLTNSEQKTALKLAENKKQTAVVYYLRGVEKEQSKTEISEVEYAKEGWCFTLVSSVYDEIKARESEMVEAYQNAVVEARHRLFRARVFTICPPQSTGRNRANKTTSKLCTVLTNRDSRDIRRWTDIHLFSSAHRPVYLL